MEQLRTVRTFELPSFGSIRYISRPRDEEATTSTTAKAPLVYLDTTRWLRLLLPRLFFSNPNRAHMHVCKVLQDRGLALNGDDDAFLRHRNSKYAFLSLKAGLCLLDCGGGEVGFPLKQQIFHGYKIILCWPMLRNLKHEKE